MGISARRFNNIFASVFHEMECAENRMNAVNRIFHVLMDNHGEVNNDELFISGMIFNAYKHLIHNG